MTPQKIFSLVLFFLLLTGKHTFQSPETSTTFSPIFFVASAFSWVLNSGDSIETNSAVEPTQGANSTKPLVDTHQRSPLPNSYYAIRFLTVDGTWRRHNGVAIQGNALLSSDHMLPSDVSSEDVVQIQITNPAGDVHEVSTPDFLIQPDQGFTIIVFNENLIPEENIALLGDADELNFGEVVYQSVVIGAEKGIYPTFIQDRFTAYENSPKEYTALRVSPDKTIVGDSGDPLYIDGVVYGINNAGDGICGAITDPDAVYTTVQQLAGTLRASPRLNPLKLGNEIPVQMNDGDDTEDNQETHPISQKKIGVAID